MLYAETYSAETELLPIPRCTNVSIEFKWACVKSDCNKFNIFFCVWCVVVALQLCNRFRCVFHILLALYISNQYAKRTPFSSLTLFRLPFSFFSYTCFHSMFIFFSSYFRNGHPIFQCYTWENRRKNIYGMGNQMRVVDVQHSYFALTGPQTGMYNLMGEKHATADMSTGLHRQQNILCTHIDI